MEKQLMIVLLILICSCSTKENNETLSDSNAVDSVALKDNVSVETKDSVNILFNKDIDFEILNSERGITKRSSTRDTVMCKDWTIEKKNIRKLIIGCDPINGPDWHHLFDVLPCIVKGQIAQGGLRYEFEINAGSWIYISSKDTTFILANFKKENERYFVSAAMDGE